MKNLTSFGDLARELKSSVKQLQPALQSAMQSGAQEVMSFAQDRLHARHDADAHAGYSSDQLHYRFDAHSFEVGTHSDHVARLEMGAPGDAPQTLLVSALNQALPDIGQAIGQAVKLSLTDKK